MQVLNGCGVPGIAGRFAKYLLDAGKPDFAIDVIDERNFGSFKQEKTMLIARRAGSPVAERLAMKLGVVAGAGDLQGTGRQLSWISTILLSWAWTMTNTCHAQWARTNMIKERQTETR